MNLEEIRGLKEEIRGGYHVIMSQLLGFLVEDDAQADASDEEEQAQDAASDLQDQQAECSESNERVGSVTR